MEKNRTKNLIVLLVFVFSCIIIQISSISMAFNSDEKNISSSDFLETNGTKIVNQNGEEVILRGYNLGLWLSRSFWGLPINMDNNSNSNLRYSPVNSIEIDYELFSNPNLTKEQVTELNNLFYSNQITETDIQNIADTGANLVRVPFEWSFFMKPEYDSSKGNIKNADYNNYGALSYIDTTLDTASADAKQFLNERLEYLKWVVEECGKRGIYVIFDLHVAPGGLNAGGFRDKPYFFENTTAGKERRDCALRIWKIVAETFKNNPTVAGYDIVNEPASFTTNNQYVSVIDFYDEAYDLIRQVEKNCANKHIIIMEGKVKSYSNSYVKIVKNYNHGGLPDPSDMGWENVIYSKHDYFFNFRNSAEDEGMDEEWQKDNPSMSIMKSRIYNSIQETKETMSEYNIPIWIGEFSCHAYYDDKSGNIIGTYQDAAGNRFTVNKEYTEEIWNYQIQQYEMNKISYAAWSYKACWEQYFGLIYYGRKIDRVDLKTATYDEIAKVFNLESAESMRYNEIFHNIFKKHIQIFSGVDISANGDGSVIATLSNDKTTLTITGKGKMADFNNTEVGLCEEYTPAKKTVSPWYLYRKNITTVKMDDDITTIGQDAFLNCTNLKKITLPENLTKIGAYAFHNCSSLASIQIPNNVTNINMSAFYSCIGLKWITLGSKVSYLGEKVFFGCNNLENIYVYKSNTSYLGIDGVLYTKDKTKIVKYPEAKKGEEYIISSNVKSIEREAFSKSKLNTIIIPKDVTEIGTNAFDECDNLTIICKAGTTVETYAKENKIPYLLDKGFPEITFTTNGTTSPVESTTTQVNVKDIGTGTITGIDYDNLYYYWGKRSEEVTKWDIVTKFSKDQMITTPKQEGTYYLWILARDKVGNEMVTRSEEFQLKAPVTALSSNNNLASLLVDGSKITNFSSTILEYTLDEVENNKANITISAEADDKNAQITGLGKKNLEIGENTFYIVVTAEDGTQKNYVINVIRQQKIEDSDGSVDENDNNTDDNTGDSGNDNNNNNSDNTGESENDNNNNNSDNTGDSGNDNNNNNSDNTGDSGNNNNNNNSDNTGDSGNDNNNNNSDNTGDSGNDDNNNNSDNTGESENDKNNNTGNTGSTGNDDINNENNNSSEEENTITKDYELIEEKGTHNKYIQGYEDGTVRVDNPVSREEIATIFYRLTTSTDRNNFKAKDDTYSDVKENRWSNNAIAYLKSKGIMKGYPDGTFKPQKQVTRAEFAAIIEKYLEVSKTTNVEFKDLNESHWANETIKAVVILNWMKGYEDGTFKPEKSITRAEVMTVINRMLNRNVREITASVNIFSDLKTTHWAYNNVMEATITHKFTFDKDGYEIWKK